MLIHLQFSLYLRHPIVTQVINRSKHVHEVVDPKIDYENSDSEFKHKKFVTNKKFVKSVVS